MSVYSPLILEHFRRPRNRGSLQGATITREGLNPLCGDRVRIELLLEGTHVHTAAFVGDACAITIAAASLLTEMIRGRSLADLRAVSDDELLRALGGRIPDARRGCALLPLATLRDGVRMHRSGFLSVIVLAAGAARRFGGPKLLADLGGEPLVRRTVARLATIHADELVVVVPPDASALREALAGMHVRIVERPQADADMSSSLRAGLCALDPRTTQLLITLADQPLIPESTLRLLLDSAEPSRPITAPLYDGVRGSPVVFDISLLPELLALTGDQGARELIGRTPDRVRLVPVPTAPPLDVDTPSDLELLRTTL